LQDRFSEAESLSIAGQVPWSWKSEHCRTGSVKLKVCALQDRFREAESLSIAEQVPWSWSSKNCRAGSVKLKVWALQDRFREAEALRTAGQVQWSWKSAHCRTGSVKLKVWALQKRFCEPESLSSPGQVPVICYNYEPCGFSCIHIHWWEAFLCLKLLTGHNDQGSGFAPCHCMSPATNSPTRHYATSSFLQRQHPVILF
jgi:hypothetical protein